VGTRLVASVLADRWGGQAPETYRKNLSLLRTFFGWHCTAGSLSANPTDGLTYPAIKRQPRRTITRAETEKILETNPEARDQVPLRLLLTLGITKATVRHLRFADFAVGQRTLSYERRGEIHTPVIEAEGFWEALETLRKQRRASADEYVLPAQKSRKYNASPDEFAAMQRGGSLDGGRRFLWQKHDGTWWRATLRPWEVQDDHGTQLWWYRCLGRAGLVPPGATSGFRMQSARYTVGRRRFTETGNLGEVQRGLGGLGTGGSAAAVYRNQDADSLDKAIRRVLRRLRVTHRERTNAVGVDHARVPSMWWKDPVSRFVQYVDDERDLIELSRVSVEMLRLEDRTSNDLHDATETLTRAVTAAELVERAQAESRDDHPLLHGHSLVAIWSALETMVFDVLDAWLLWWPPARQHAESMFSTIDFTSLAADDRASAARESLEGKHRSRHRLEHFEWLLDGIGLPPDAETDARMEGNIFEMQQIRNVFAHKRGRADKRLTDYCPQLPFRVGDQIRIDRDAWSDFLVTTVLYADSLTRRMKRELGLPDWLRPVKAPAIRYPLEP
jgi:hypothetical protein